MPPRSAHFNPPAPCGAGLRSAPQGCGAERFQSTRPLRGGTALWVLCDIEALFQSTRPLRGGTRSHVYPTLPTQNFNPPAPCGAGLQLDYMTGAFELFQSTRPLRGGTSRNSLSGCSTSRFQSTRPLRGGTQLTLLGDVVVHISIHPPLAGRDSTSRSEAERRDISIHPPLAGRDSLRWCRRCPAKYFNPPAPCGAGRLPVVRRSG